MNRAPHPLSLCAAIAALALGACAPEIGDACNTSLDCSSQGSRLCDRTQPNGYCTLRGCEQGTCPEEAVCVKFRPAQERLAMTWCMARCEDDGDCRTGEDYRCTTGDEFSVTGSPEAEVLDSRVDVDSGTRAPGQRFCSFSLASAEEAEATANSPQVSQAGKPSIRD